jgi:hypothetical protein
MNWYRILMRRPRSQESQQKQRETEMPSHGNIPILVRVVWGALVAFTLVIFVASLPVYYEQLQALCQANCASGQLSPATAQTLQSIGLSPNDYALFRLILAIAYAVVGFVVGGVLAWRRSDERMALLVALLLIMQGTIALTSTVSGSHSIWQFPASLLSFLAFLAYFLVFSVFPSGHFVPRWIRWLVIPFIALGVGYSFFPAVKFNSNFWLNLFGTLLWVGLVISLVAAQIYRYWQVSTPIQRQQTKWVVFVFVVFTVLGFGSVLLSLIFPSLNRPGSLYPLIFDLDSGGAFALALPLSFAVAILRYRLWDIDVLINRTLVYGTLTVILTAVYVGLVIGLQALLRGIISQDNGVAIIISTLAIAALFQPLRRRIQRLIDRRFYRSKYDAAKTLAAFNATLRQEVDLEQLREHLLAVVQETMQPAHVSLWLRPPAQDRKYQATWIRTSPARQREEKS